MNEPSGNSGMDDIVYNNDVSEKSDSLPDFETECLKVCFDILKNRGLLKNEEVNNPSVMDEFSSIYEHNFFTTC